MSYQLPQNGNGRSNGLIDIGKTGLGIGMALTLGCGLFLAGDTWGSWKSTMTKITEQVAGLQVSAKRTDERLSAMETTLARLDQRWAVEVRK